MILQLQYGSLELDGKFLGFISRDLSGKYPWHATDTKGASTHKSLGAAIDWLIQQAALAANGE